VSDIPGRDTARRFGFQWERYDDFFPGYEEQFRGWIAPLGPEAFAGREVLDAGCGMGRNAWWASRYGAARVVAVDAAETTVASARRTLARAPGARAELASLYDLAYDADFDVVFSIGVIHHLEHPRRALERLVRALRPGGTLLVWLYAFEGNEWIARIFRLLHPVLRRLPPRLLHALAHGLSLPLWLLLRLPWRKTAYLQQISRFPLPHLHTIVLDQLVPEITRYYRREEVENLFSGLDLARVQIHPNRGYSWTVVGERG